MRVWIDHDDEIDAWTIRHDSVKIESRADIAEWSRQLRGHLNQLGPDKVYLLVDLRGFTLDPNFAEEYGRVVKSVVSRFAKSIVRYGVPGGLTKAAVRTAAIRNHFPSNIFADRDAACAALGKIRQLPAA